MKRVALLPAVGILALLSACAQVPEQYSLHGTTEGGPATVEVTVDGVGTTLEIADGETWSMEYTSPKPPFSVTVSVTAESTNEEQVVMCSVADAADPDEHLSSGDAKGPAGSSIICSIDVD